MEHFGLRGRGVKELCAAVEDDLGKHVDAEDGRPGEEDVEEAGDFAEGLDVVGVHGQGAREGEEGLCMREVGPEARVDGVEDGWDEAELSDGGGEVGQHKVSDAQRREARDGGAAQGGGEDEEEDLGDVVVALEVVQVRVAAENGKDDVGEGCLLPSAFVLVLVFFIYFSTCCPISMGIYLYLTCDGHEARLGSFAGRGCCTYSLGSKQMPCRHPVGLGLRPCGEAVVSTTGPLC